MRLAVRFFLRGLLIGAFLSAPASGQIFRWLAFGDSITAGWSDDINPSGGYPGRLENDLGCTPSTCQVVEKGLAGETTAEGVTRIRRVLNNSGPDPYDVALIMEGTNDIFQPNNISNVSIPTIMFNLNQMATKAEKAGTEAVLASIIWLHPGGQHGTSRDQLVEDLRDRLSSSARNNSRLFADTWSRLCSDGPDQHGHSQNACFWNHDHYWLSGGQPDVVGHPNSSGFRMIADEFFALIDSSPVPGLAVPSTPSGMINDATPILTWTQESPALASWYQVRVTGPGGTYFQTWVKASQVCSGSTCSTEVTSSLDDNSYAWQVMSRNARGRSGWSSQRSFTIGSPAFFADGFESGDTSEWSSTVQ